MMLPSRLHPAVLQAHGDATMPCGYQTASTPLTPQVHPSGAAARDSRADGAAPKAVAVAVTEGAADLSLHAADAHAERELESTEERVDIE